MRPAEGRALVEDGGYALARCIQSMSDYCGACAYDWKRRHGEKACPFNSLYWDFLNRHRRLLEENPRMGMMLRTWSRLASAEKRQVLNQAAAYRKDLDRL